MTTRPATTATRTTTATAIGLSRTVGTLAALVAGLASIADWLVQLRHVQPDSHWQGIDLLIEALFALSLIGAVVAVHGFSRWLAVGRVGRIAAIVAEVGFALLFVASAASAIAGGNLLGAVFSGGLLLALLGSLVFGIAGVVRSNHRWAAALPFLGLFLSVAAAPFGGQLLFGVAWLAITWGMSIGARRSVPA